MTKLGKLFVVGIQGSRLLEEEREMLKRHKPAGVILFRKNIDQGSANWQSSLKELIGEIRDAVSEKIFISIDHEGGKVHRLFDPITHFSAAINWREDSFQVGHTMGTELSNLGIDVIYAPVLDIHLEPTNPVIGERSFGITAEEVITFSEQFCEGLKLSGVIPCGKHFPGHGRTTTDSHFALPVLNLSMDELFENELKPFIHHINKQIDMIMSAHINFPQIDTLPATLSKKLINDLLRARLGYRGIIITDDLEMSALNNFSIEERVMMAIIAGNNLALIGYPKAELSTELMRRSIAHLSSKLGVVGGDELEAVVNDSIFRVTEFIDKI